jgi:predicted ATP-grasp superfamily ATP-dependent carboligase
MTPTVLVTNYNYKNSLAAVRDIGKNGVKVHTCGPPTRNRVASFSKYSSGWATYTSPNESMESFIIDIKKILSARKYSLILPIGVDTTIPCSYHKEELQKYTRVPVADFEVLDRAHDKFQTIEIARKIGVPVPCTSMMSVETLEQEPLRYPIVIKARKGASGSGTRYATSKDELNKIVQEFEEKETSYIHDYEKPMIQEYIPGELLDVCALFNEGQPRAALAQRRVITFPPSGGVGIVNETIEDPELIELATRLLKKMDWHGVAQIEFKRDEHGVPRLMEVNPKFWGTLELSIAAGMNFPYMLYKMTMEGDIEPRFDYERNLQIWWSFAHLSQIYFACIKNRSKVFSALKGKKRRRISDLSRDDLKPHVFQISEGAVRLLRFKRMLSHPLSR